MQQSDIKHISWHDSAWNELWANPSGLPHALLLTGREGIGKGRFALAAAARLLCESLAGSDACGQCPSCRWFLGGNHPDFRHVIPAADLEAEEADADTERKKGSRQILIDQIRELEDFVFVGGHRNGARVVVIEPAEAMNHAAQNALLKILEEPPASVYFILISYRWRRLLPTIRSRCRSLALARPNLTQAKAWLKSEGADQAAGLLPLVGHAPLLALAENTLGRGAILIEVMGSLANPGRNSLQLAARWQALLQLKSESGLVMDRFVELVQKWLFELVLVKLSGRQRLNEGQGAAARQLAEKASAAALLRCYNDLMKIRALASHPLNPQLFLEDIAERYLHALAMERT
ncbi:MAG: DNA polymerase III subunit delta' [Zoogloeaceae bacterium]|nr:DNA polymerase III subunit delta' [Zoogloeaceae bacterium]